MVDTVEAITGEAFVAPFFKQNGVVIVNSSLDLFRVRSA